MYLTWKIVDLVHAGNGRAFTTSRITTHYLYHGGDGRGWGDSCGEEGGGGGGFGRDQG